MRPFLFSYITVPNNLCITQIKLKYIFVVPSKKLDGIDQFLRKILNDYDKIFRPKLLRPNSDYVRELYSGICGSRLYYGTGTQNHLITLFVHSLYIALSAILYLLLVSYLVCVGDFFQLLRCQIVLTD